MHFAPELKKQQKAIYDVTGEYGGYICFTLRMLQKELDAQVKSDPSTVECRSRWTGNY